MKDERDERDRRPSDLFLFMIVSAIKYFYICRSYINGNLLLGGKKLLLKNKSYLQNISGN